MTEQGFRLENVGTASGLKHHAHCLLSHSEGRKGRVLEGALGLVPRITCWRISLSSQDRSASHPWHDCTTGMPPPVLLCLMLPMPLPSATARNGNRTWTASSHCPTESLCPACSWPTRYTVNLGKWPLAAVFGGRASCLKCSSGLGWQNHLYPLSRDVETFFGKNVECRF